MEDAMILNKGAYERGFGHGCVYKSYIRELNEGSTSGSKSTFRMFNSKKKEMEREAGINLSEYGLEPDGLPPFGKNLK